MKKYLLLLLPLLAVFFVSCDDEVSHKEISMYHVEPQNGVVNSDGGEITIMVASTHSFQLSSDISDVSFFEEGIVKYKKDGVAVIETQHLVYVAPNNTGKERRFYIQARQLMNADMVSTLLFVQPAKIEPKE
ncbi:MAG: hypothetical protein K2J00_06970 [Bacteroidaceae bacterium]|nr:hypothetical protein [Bacteroidaceae bacterium]